MTATDVLRRLLDERGVEWTSGDTEVSRNKYTHFCPDAGMSMGVWESGDGKLGIDAHTDYRFTPEQAIVATLGAGTCHPKPHEQWTTVLLPEIAWGWDNRWPDYLSVAHDARGEWRVYVPEATLGRGTCHIKPWKMERDTVFYDCMECECGYVSDVSDWAKWHFCPNCGARVVEPTKNDVDVEVEQ